MNYKRNLILMLLFVSFITASVGLTVPTASAGIPAGMVSYWKLDETTGTTAYDYLGTYDGTNYGATINQPGQVGAAYSFDGNDYVDTGDISELNSVSAFTILGWIKQTVNTANERVFDKIKDGNNDISIAPYGGKIYFELGNGGNTYAYWNDYSSTIPSGTWYHLAAVFDGSGATNADKTKIYVNGVERSLTFSGSIPSSTSAHLSGYSFTLSRPSDDFNGEMDEVAIFNRALSASEILDLYDKGLAGHGYCWPPPVGGLWVPINKFELLAPWIGLASLITVTAVSVVYVKRRKKQQT